MAGGQDQQLSQVRGSTGDFDFGLGLGLGLGGGVGSVFFSSFFSFSFSSFFFPSLGIFFEILVDKKNKLSVQQQAMLVYLFITRAAPSGS